MHAKLRNAEADRDRFKEQADRNFRDKEEYRQMYEQAKSQARFLKGKAGETPQTYLD